MKKKEGLKKKKEKEQGIFNVNRKADNIKMII